MGTKSAELARQGGAGGTLGRGPLGWKRLTWEREKLRRTQHLGSPPFLKDPGILAPLPLLSLGVEAPREIHQWASGGGSDASVLDTHCHLVPLSSPHFQIFHPEILRVG